MKIIDIAKEIQKHFKNTQSSKQKSSFKMQETTKLGILKH